MSPFVSRPFYIGLLLCLVLFGLALLTACSAQVVTQTPILPSPTDTPAPPPLEANNQEMLDAPSPTFSAFYATVDAMMATLPTTTPVAGLIQEKAEQLQRDDLYYRALQALHEQGIFIPVPISTPVDPIPHPEPTHQIAGAGVIVDESCWGAPGDRLIHSENYWLGQWENDYIQLYAGNFMGTPPRGAILLKVYDLQAQQYVG